MSVGTPPSNVDNAPGHGHSHRGHSRSTRWAQPPPPPPPSLGPDNSSPKDVVNSDSRNGQVSQVTWTNNQHLHSHATPHHHHHHTPSLSSVHSVYSDALNGHDRGNGGMIAPEKFVRSVDSKSELIHEITTGLLIALPWIALSWYHSNCEQPCKAPSADSPDRPVWEKTGMLTAITLLVFGCGQLLRTNYQSGTIKFPALDAKSAQTSIFQICSLGLPIYAALKIGGFLVAFALLLSTASGIPSLVSGDLRVVAKERYIRKTLTIALLVATILLSFSGLNQPLDPYPVPGYLALLAAIFVLAPPFPSMRHQGPMSEPGLAAKDSTSDAVVITTDAMLALISGAILALFTVLYFRAFPLGVSDLIFFLVPACLLALSLMIAIPSRFRSSDKIGLAVCTGAAALLCFPHTQDDLIFVYVARGILSTVSFFAARMDDSHLRLDAHSHTHSHHHHHHGSTDADCSRVSKWVLHQSEPYPLLYSILKETDSRSIFYFMCLNFAFMLIQLSYGFLTGSLGLLSDSIHMFFDCLALVVGLCAAVMSKWPPNARFPYGYGKVDTLSGFANGIFLMIISVEIIYEAVERLSSGSQMHRIGELLAVSMAGLAVNLIGIFSFNHGHAHHGHGHDHSHGNENMHGIFLHILADTLGSVAVVVSTVLVHYSGWSGYDPLASCLIAILIFSSAVPLVSSTSQALLLTLPADTEYNVRETLAGVNTLRGVAGYTVPKFWLDDTVTSDPVHAHDHTGHGRGDSHEHEHEHDHYHHHHDHDHDHHDHAHEKKNPNVLGVIHVIASRGADLDDVRQRTVHFLQEKGMDIVVQVERDGDGRCWCGGGHKGS